MTAIRQTHVLSVLVLGVVGLLASALPGAAQFTYNCTNPCVAPDCVCASLQPPGDLAAEETPQIILLTFDDNVSTNDGSYQVAQQVLTNHFNPNGTPIQATFYVKTGDSDYRAVQQMYAQGHEIAMHSMTHTTTTNTDIDTWRREIFGARKAISDLAQIPLEKIVGFRAPGLYYNQYSMQALAEAGLEYDSSIEEGLWDGLSQNGSYMVWPYTFDNGPGQFVAQPLPEQHAGLFEVPVWEILNNDGTPACLMDFPTGTYSQVMAIFQNNLENRWMGNRAPMGLFTHTYVLGEAGYEWRVDLVNEFISWALTNFGSNVWFVSNHSLIEFMRNPVACSNAATFPPFITTTNSIPVDSVVTCLYTTTWFTTCGTCPPEYPYPHTVFGEAVAITGGVIRALTNLYDQAEVRISNNTDKVITDWLAEFRVWKGQVRILWPGTFTQALVGSGTKVVLRPNGTDKPLWPGEVEVNTFEVTNTLGANIIIMSNKVTLFELQPTRPTLESVVFTDSNEVVASWNNAAANYELSYTTNKDLNLGWQTVEVHGRTSTVVALPEDADSAVFRLKTMY